MDEQKLKNILEAGLLVAARTMSLAQLEALFQNDAEKPERKQIRAALDSLKEDYQGRGIELVEVASGYRLQSHESVADWVSNLFQEKPPRYSRALLETLVLIAYRQPITRAEIEDVRGVAVSSNIIKTLQERQWVKVLGHKEVPGRPALLGTTKEFLDYFNLKKLDELPELAEIKDLDQFDELLAEEVGEVGEQGDAANDDGSAGNESHGTNGSSSGNGSGAGIESGEGDAPASDSDGQYSTGDQSAGDADSAHMNLSDEQAQEQTQEQTESDRIKKMSAMLDVGAADLSDEDGNAEEHNPDDAKSSAERKLLRVISEFSEEHQQQIDARDELEADIVSAKGGEPKEDEIDENDLSDLSQRIGDDKQSGGMPDPGDTLH